MGSNYKTPGVNAADRTKWDGTTTTVAANSGSWQTVALLSSNQIDTIFPIATSLNFGTFSLPFSTVHTKAVDFNPELGTPDYAEGILFYDQDNYCLTLYSDNSAVKLQVGQESWIRVKNPTVTQLNNGTLVYIASAGPGIKGAISLVELAKADAENTSCGTIAMITHDLPADEEGFATAFGLVRDIDTSAYIDGTILYLSPTTAGGFTDVKPVAPNHLVTIGYVIRQHATEGAIFVTIKNGWELHELHDVYFDDSKLQNGDMLAYNSVSSRWESTSALQLVNDTLSTKSIRVGPNNTDTFYLTNNATVWNDVVVPLIMSSNVNQTDSAVLTQWGTGNLFIMKFSSGNYQTWPVVEIPHDWKSTRVYPHIHWCADTASTGEQVVWGLEITWAGLLNGLWKPNSTLTYYATAQTAGQYTQVITNIPEEGILPETFAEGASSISSIMVCRLFLDIAQTTPAIVDGVSFDVHYEVDSLGSENIVQKFYS